MDKFKKSARIFSIFSKRWMRHPLFWMLLVLVPILILGLRLVAQQDAGIVTVAIAMETPLDDAAQEIVDDLLETPSVIKFNLCKDAEEARSYVHTGRADAAWIFPKDFSLRLQATSKRQRELVEILEKENNLLLQISRKKLFLAIYPYFGDVLYRDFVFNTLELDGKITEGQLQEYKDDIVSGERFIVLSSTEGTMTEDIQVNYLVSPARGILAILLVISALASVMYYQYDKDRECFIWCQNARSLPLLYHGALLLYLELAIFVSLIIAKIQVGIFREIFLLLIYGLSCIGFAEVIRHILRRISRIGASIPLLTLGMLALCPVFFNLKKFRFLQLLLPPFHYLNALYSDRYILYIIGYTILLWGIVGLWARYDKRDFEK